MTLPVTIYRPQRQEPAPPSGVLRNSWRVGKRTVTITQDVTMTRTPGVGWLRCEWSPNVPRKLRKAEMRQYKAGMAAHYQQLANLIGGNVAAVAISARLPLKQREPVFEKPGREYMRRN